MAVIRPLVDIELGDEAIGAVQFGVVLQLPEYVVTAGG